MLLNKLSISGLLILSLISCQKENTLTTEYQLNGTTPSLEAARIIADVSSGNDYHGGIVVNHQYGESMGIVDNQVYFSGNLPSGCEIKIGDYVFTENVNTSSWMLLNDSLKGVFGTVNTFKFSEGILVDSVSRYVRTCVLFNPLSNLPNKEINRTGNNLTWSVDNTSLSNKIALRYVKYQDDGNGNYEPYDGDILLIDDNGVFNIDGLLSDTNCKKISLTGTCGNTFKLNYNGEDVLISAASYDFHHYYIK